MDKNSKIFVAGHTGLVGSAILRQLKKNNFSNIITQKKGNLDLRNQNQVKLFIKNKKPKIIIIAAAKVGGIIANFENQADFIYDNIMIQTNLINAAKENKIKNLIFLGSSCIYPKYCKQPIKESYLLNGKLEISNQAYALAKISGIQMCSSYNFQYGLNYKCLMPTNTYGENDNYDLKTSHFYPAMIKKFFYAQKYKQKKISLYGTGSPKRELMYVDDLANACIYFLQKKTKETLINIGSGEEYTIRYYANFLKKLISPKCKIFFDHKYPNGTPRKFLDTSLAKSYGWYPQIFLKEGTKKTIDSFKLNYFKKI